MLVASVRLVAICLMDYSKCKYEKAYNEVEKLIQA